MYASDAIIDLYENSVDVSQISKVLSMGMLGRKKIVNWYPRNGALPHLMISFPNI